MFIQVLKKHINLKSHDALFIYINSTLPPCSYTLGQLYDENYDKNDNMLHLHVAKENTYG
jgi:hypothetical protein